MRMGYLFFDSTNEACVQGLMRRVLLCFFSLRLLARTSVGHRFRPSPILKAPWQRPPHSSLVTFNCFFNLTIIDISMKICLFN
jgi:hypothetical protein